MLAATPFVSRSITDSAPIYASLIEADDGDRHLRCRTATVAKAGYSEERRATTGRM